MNSFEISEIRQQIGKFEKTVSSLDTRLVAITHLAVSKQPEAACEDLFNSVSWRLSSLENSIEQFDNFLEKMSQRILSIEKYSYRSVSSEFTEEKVNIQLEKFFSDTRQKEAKFKEEINCLVKDHWGKLANSIENKSHHLKIKEPEKNLSGSCAPPATKKKSPLRSRNPNK